MQKQIQLREIQLREQMVYYNLKISKRAKHMRIAIYRDCTMVVTAPRWMNTGAIEQFISRKAEWILSKLDYFKSFVGTFSNSTFSKIDQAEVIKYKEQALALAQSRIDFFNQHYNFQFKKISIRKQKTRWGSCSKTGNLSFNYKIALLPQRAADYIIVHELCHLGEFNHSKKFWGLVAQTIPDYVQIKKELNKKGLSI